MSPSRPDRNEHEGLSDMSPSRPDRNEEEENPPHALVERHGDDNGWVVVTLNRPNTINALTVPMIRTHLDVLHDLLKRVATPTSDTGGERRGRGGLLLQGAGGRGLCAGGNVREVIQSALAGDLSTAASFFTLEYESDWTIARLPPSLPHVSVWDGIVMGGGVGCSIHGSVRLATERTVWAMPETKIGMFPDVGASYFLSREELGEMGTCLGLTGISINGRDCRNLGFATHLIHSSLVPKVVRKLLQHPPDPDVVRWGRSQRKYPSLSLSLLLSLSLSLSLSLYYSFLLRPSEIILFLPVLFMP